MSSLTRPTNGFADIQGARLYYEAAGSGPPLVLLHARVADSRMWDANWQALAAHCTVIRYDLRGHGRSPMPSGPFSHVADLAHLLEYFSLPQAILVGSSMGGEIAIDFTLQQPDNVTALILAACAPAGYGWSSQMEPKWKAIFAALEQGDFAGAVELELQLWVDGPQRRPNQVDSMVREQVREMDTANWLSLADYRHRAQPLLPTGAPAASRLHEIAVPTLVVVGSDDIADIHAGAELLATHIPNAEKAEFDGAGHMLTMEQPERFNRLVEHFVRSL